MDHIVYTLFYDHTFLGTIEENRLVEVAIPNMTKHTAKQSDLAEVILRNF